MGANPAARANYRVKNKTDTNKQSRKQCGSYHQSDDDKTVIRAKISLMMITE
jgi:hypothetical protein